MQKEEAASTLKRRYEQALEGEKVAAIHVFAIEFADQIRHMPKSELATLAGISPKYSTELNKASSWLNMLS